MIEEAALSKTFGASLRERISDPSQQDMGTVILGKLESGCISKAQQLVMMPNRVRPRTE